MKKKLFIKASLAAACFSLALLVAGCEVIDNLFGEDHSLTIQVEGEGSVEPSEGVHDYEKDSSVNLRAVPAEGWSFREWVGEVASRTSSETIIEMTEDRVVKAIFEEDAVLYTLTVDVEGEGTVEPEAGVHEFVEGVEVDLVAHPDPGWAFVEWIGDVSDRDSPETSVVMDGNKEVKVVFEEASMFELVDQDPQGQTTFNLLHFITGDEVVGARSLFQWNDGGDLYHSEDGGENFEPSREYVAPLRGSFSFVDEKTGYVVGHRSAFGISMFIGKTEDGGRSWGNLSDRDLSNLREIMPVNRDAGNVAATTDGKVFFVTGGSEGPPRIYASLDEGKSWEVTEEGTPFYTWSMGVAGDRPYVASLSGFMYNSQGSHWDQMDAPWDDEGGYELVCLTFASLDDGWALVENTNAADNRLTLYRTTNGAQDWVEVSQAPGDDRTVVFPRQRGLIRHEDKLFGTATVELEGESDRVYVVYSKDGGETWTHDIWNEHGSRSIRLINAAGELRVYSLTSNRIDIGYYGVYQGF